MVDGFRQLNLRRAPLPACRALIPTTPDLARRDRPYLPPIWPASSLLAMLLALVPLLHALTHDCGPWSCEQQVMWLAGVMPRLRPAANGPLQEILGLRNPAPVSCDYVNDPAGRIVDASLQPWYRRQPAQGLTPVRQTSGLQLPPGRSVALPLRPLVEAARAMAVPDFSLSGPKPFAASSLADRQYAGVDSPRRYWGFTLH